MSVRNNRGASPLSAYALEVVSAQPDPPRRVDRRALRSHVYRSRRSRLVLGVGAGLGVPALLLGIASWRVSVATAFLLTVGLLLAVGLPLVPALQARRLHRGLRHGVVARAAVTGLSFQEPVGDQTVDALAHGFAAGTARVDRPGAPFGTDFEIDAAWGQDLRPGSRLVALVDPVEDAVLLWLGTDDERSKA